MNTLIKYTDTKWILISFLTAGFILISNNYVHAQYIKKIEIEPLKNPTNWNKSFEPGIAFTLRLKNTLENSGQFQILQQAKITNTNNATSLINKQKNSKEQNLEKSGEKKTDPIDTFNQTPLKPPSSQYRVSGRILVFDPDTSHLNKVDQKKQRFRHKEKAHINTVIEIINLRNGRSLARKSFKFISNDGRIPFNLDWTTFEYETLKFKSSSIGKAFWKLNNLITSFVIHTLNNVPLEGDLILVDLDAKSAVINLGKSNGVMVQDVFTVFSMQAGFNDPLNQISLGDKYTRKGVIKIIEVQERFSKAKIMAGLDLAPGDLIVPKYRKNRKKTSENQVSQKNIIWGSYKGLPSLSY